MATTNTLAEMALKPQTRDYAVIEVHKEVTNEDGSKSNDITFTAISGKETIQKAKDEGRFRFEQTVSWNEATNDEGQKKVIRNEKDRAKAFNSGVMSSLINPRVKRLLEEVEEIENPENPSGPKIKVLVFEPVQGSYDLDEIINEPAQRRSLSDMEKAVAAMKPLFPGKTEEEIYAMLTQLKSMGMALPGQDGPDSVEVEESEGDTVNA